MKKFIITIDVEGDNLWGHRIGDAITTENAKYIPRFQKLCEKFNFKPVYLTNYEMANDNYFVQFAKCEVKNNTCEIGLHVHAWNTPPFYTLAHRNDGKGGLPYLIEYPDDIMREKIKNTLGALQNSFGCNIVSHRSGRWAMNGAYFDMLIDAGIKTDCSVAPHINWQKSYGFSPQSNGPDYSDFPESAHRIKHRIKPEYLWEVPVTVRNLRYFPKHGSAAARVKAAIFGRTVWLRPTGNNLNGMLALVNKVQDENCTHLMFMLHSSELMPDGSPNFRGMNSIEKLYADLEILFEHISNNFVGISLSNLYLLLEQNEKNSSSYR
jgi:hypothetical protein